MLIPEFLQKLQICLGLVSSVEKKSDVGQSFPSSDQCLPSPPASLMTQSLITFSLVFLTLLSMLAKSHFPNQTICSLRVDFTTGKKCSTWLYSSSRGFKAIFYPFNSLLMNSYTSRARMTTPYNRCGHWCRRRGGACLGSHCCLEPAMRPHTPGWTSATNCLPPALCISPSIAPYKQDRLKKCLMI